MRQLKRGPARARPHQAADRLLVRAGCRGGGWAIVAGLATIVSSAIALAFPAILGRAVDRIVTHGDAGPWLAWSAGLVVLLVAASALDILAVGEAVARSTAWLRRTLLSHELALGLHAHQRIGPGEMATRIVANAAEAGRIAPAAMGAGSSLLVGLGGTVALALINPLLCAAFLAGMPALLLIVRAFARDATALTTGYLTVQGHIAERLTEAISGARTIAAAGTLQREADRALAPLPQLRRHGMDLWRVNMRITARDALLVAMLEILVVGISGVMLARGQLSAGEMLAAAQYVLLAASLNSVTGIVATLTRARAAAQRLVEILAQRPVSYGQRQLPLGRGRLELRGVSVRVGGELALDGIDLVVPAGAMVAIVGRSGSGKSLLAAVIGRLVDPDEGEVLLDGAPLQELAHSELRRAVAYGFARPALFGETVADAIAFGHEEPTPDEVAAAARSARAEPFIRMLPAGIGTPLAQAPMSGGEIQRIGLARTFAHAGRVVVLDDVAASLDTVTEHHISQVLTGALADRTRVIVAHRASTVARVDTVIWLERGQLHAMATHDALWRTPAYRTLFAPDDGSPPAAALGAGMAVVT